MGSQETLFATEQITEATGKNTAALAWSRSEHERIIGRFSAGTFPQSIMKAEVSSRGSSDCASGSGKRSSQHLADNPGVPRDMVFSRSCDHKLSVFPQNVARACLELYSERGHHVIDPFAGHNSRMEACAVSGRHYTGSDLCREFMDFNRGRSESLRSDFPGWKVSLLEGDSRMTLRSLESESFDFTLTSPPYYRQEWYGPEPQQLRNEGTYQDFITELGVIASLNAALLKPGAFCVWFVNDFRSDGVFVPFHVDTMTILSAAGLVLHDVMIVDLGSPATLAWMVRNMEKRYLPKRHEYGIVMRKPVAREDAR